MKCLHAGVVSSLVKTYHASVRLVFSKLCHWYALSFVSFIFCKPCLLYNPHAAFCGYNVKYEKVLHFFGVILVGFF